MRDHVKAVLHRTGLFPAARAIYRTVNPQIRSQRRKEIEFYRSVLPDRAVCFDIGANLGQRAEIFLEISRRCVVVEPNPSCRPTLGRLFVDKSKVDLVFEAVGSKVGEIELYCHGSDATASVVPGWDRSVFGVERSLSKITVPMTTLDALISRYGTPDFVKIDVEGFETDVLRGLSQKIQILSFEYHAKYIDRLRECFAILTRLSSCLVRASDMDCSWITAATSDFEECISHIQRMDAKGDIFVWMIEV